MLKISKIIEIKLLKHKDLFKKNLALKISKKN